MRIIAVDGYVWPYHILCECGITFSVEFPEDLRTKREYSYLEINDISVPEAHPLQYFSKCPICGKEHPISADNIPKIIKERVHKSPPTYI